MDFQNSITLDRLRYFVEAAKRQHVGEAARYLHVSPSVVSSAIKLLEDDLGCQLFIRERQTIKLNEEGRRLLEHAESILHSVLDLKTDVRSPKTLLNGHFRLSASHYLMDKYLVPSILKLQNSESRMTFELSSMDSGVSLAQLQAGLLELCLIFRSSYSDSLDETILWSGFFQVAVRKNHPVLKLPVKKRSEAISKLPSIAFRTSQGPNFWERHPALASLGIHPMNSYFYDDTQTAIALLERTDGWAFLPELIIQNNNKIAPVTFSKRLEAPVNVSLVTNGSQRSNQVADKLKNILLID